MQDAQSQPPRSAGVVRLLVALAATAALIRLVPLALLHPLQWDEIEYFRATDWVRQGLVPYRDFWEHHTPLQWYLFAPFTALTDSPGVDAVILMRWAQIPIWIATFWFLLSWMRRVGSSAFSICAAMALILASSMFMTPAVEYRIDTLGVFFFAGGLWLAQRMHERVVFAAGAGVFFCLAGFANLRLGPLLVATAILLRVIYTPDRRWADNGRANWLLLSASLTLALGLLWFSLNDSLLPLYEQVWYENYVGEGYAEGVAFGFAHRVLVPFGIRILGASPGFDPAGVDPGGIAIFVLGLIGLIRALRTWRRPDDHFVLAILQVVSLVFVGMMKFVYHYHLEIVAIAMVPLVAHALDLVKRRHAVVAVVVAAWGVNVYASLFRGKELDRAYQDLVMREAHARTSEKDVVWDGVGWALRRKPAYHFWFLPELARHLVLQGHAEPYRVKDVVAHPPGAVIADHNALTWLSEQPELRRFIVHHYIPLWRNLWIPAMSGRLDARTRSIRWMVLRDGRYRVHASADLAGHPWFERPMFVGSYWGPGQERLEYRTARPAAPDGVVWRLDGRPLRSGPVFELRKGQSIEVTSTSETVLGLILLPGDEPVLFRQPPPTVTLDAAAARVAHVPEFFPQIR